MDISKTPYEKQINKSFVELEEQSLQIGVESLLRRLCFIGSFAHILFLFFFALVGATELAILNIFSVGIWVFATVQNMKQRLTLCIRLIMFELIAHAYIVTFVIGADLGFHYYLWAMMGFILAGPIDSIKRQTGISLLVTIGFVIIYFFSRDKTYPYAIPEIVPFVYGFNVIMSVIPFIFIVYFLRKSSNKGAKRFFLEANTDSVTGTFNRLYIEKLIKGTQDSLNRREFDQYCVMLCKVNNISAFADKFGKELKNKALKTIAMNIQDIIRDSDIISRWDEDTFMVLLMNTNRATTLRLTAQIAEKVINHEFFHQVQDDSLHLSFGIADSNENKNLESLLEIADIDLHQQPEVIED